MGREWIREGSKEEKNWKGKDRMRKRLIPFQICRP